MKPWFPYEHSLQTLDFHIFSTSMLVHDLLNSLENLDLLCVHYISNWNTGIYRWMALSPFFSSNFFGGEGHLQGTPMDFGAETQTVDAYMIRWV